VSRPLFVSGGLIVLLSVSVAGQSPASTTTPARASYDIDFIGPPLADPVMQHAKETYVLFGCAYCHGVTLTPRGEATDLRRSALVGADIDGDRIVALLRAGIPQTAKLSPMPQFSDLSDRQLHDIANYIHYARQESRYTQIVDATRCGHAGGVAEREAVGARVDEVARELRHSLGRDVALVRAAEGGGNDGLGLDAARVRDLDDVTRPDQ